MIDAKDSNSIKISFYLIGFKKKNLYEFIKFETLLKKPVKIEKETFQLTIELDEEKSINNYIDEHIYMVPFEKECKEKEYYITLFCDINNVYNLVVNEEGDCSLEITSMWDINYEDKITEQERRIPDIPYDGKIIDNYDELFERKRLNIINAKIEKFGKDLFSSETLDYLKKNKNKSYKYDILKKKENNMYLLSEKGRDKPDKVLDENEKKELENQIITLKKQLNILFQEMEKEADNFDKCQIMKRKLNMFLYEHRLEYKNLEKTFKLFNKRWNLRDFTQKDFELFLLFSEVQIFFKKYNNAEDIDSNVRKTISPKYDKLKQDVLSNASLNLIEKTQIICGFSDFCNKLMKKYTFPELVIVKDLNDEDPFKQAIEKYKVILNNITEKSGLFKLLLLFDMGSTDIINEWDFNSFEVRNYIYNPISDTMSSSKYSFKEFKKKFDENNERKKKEDEEDEEDESSNKLTFPILSMLTLKQVKNHSLELLPKFFFKVPNEYNFNAVSKACYRISFYNVNKIFRIIGEQEQKKINPKSCVLPLMIEISHEDYSHLKITFFDLKSNSLILNPIQGRKILMCSNDYEAECGHFLEYIIADDYQELKHLKLRNINLYTLTDTQYWIDFNFNKMKEFNKKEMENDFYNKIKSKNEYENLAKYDKRAFDEDKNIRCLFKKFNS